MNTKKHLQQLIKNQEIQLVDAEVQAWIFQKEVDHPMNIGLKEAKDNLQI